MSLRMTLAALSHMKNLEANWDSYGAKRIDKRAIERAKEIAGTLSGNWQAVPVSDGSVQLESHEDGFDIEIRVAASAGADHDRG